MDRLLLLDKPLEWTSFDVVNKVRYFLKEKKVGHAGTLDPLATGLLIVCCGALTKQIAGLQDMEKEYTGTFVIGKTTASHDLETALENEKDIQHITEKDIQEAARKFIGKIAQVPPMHSAIKVNGKRSYKLARKGKKIELAAREIEIRAFDVQARLPEVDFKVICTKGTYIRSLVRDMGEALGVGAYLSRLCRTRIGNYSLNDAITIEQLLHESIQHS